MGMQGIIPPNIDYNKNVSDRYEKKIYKKGETCIKYNKLHQAKENIDAPEEWNPVHWEETTVEQIRAQIQQKLSVVNTNIANITPDDTAVDGKPWTSKHIVDMLCPPLKVSGNPVQCYPVAGYPLGITASWEPTQEGTGDPSPDNIRPIKGRDSVSFSRYGCNIITTPYRDKTKSENGVQFTVNDDWSVAIKGTATDITYFNLCINNILRKFVNKGVYSALDVPQKVGIFTVSGCTMQARDNDVTMYIAVAKGRTIDKTVYPIVLVGSTVPEVVPGPSEYNVNTLTLPETIYGGSVDAVSGAGELLYNKANIRMEKLEYNKGVSAMLGYASQNLLNDIQLPSSNSITFNGVCDCLPPKPASEINSGAIGFGVSASGDIYLKAEGLDSAEAYAAKFPNGVNVCYKVATPTSFSAAGSAPIKALSGVNTVLTDADSIEVTGREDLIHAIAGQ